MDFVNSFNLDWRYIIDKDTVWQLDPAPDGYKPQIADEAAVLQLLYKYKLAICFTSCLSIRS
jgi:hypothetical protein